MMTTGEIQTGQGDGLDLTLMSGTIMAHMSQDRGKPVKTTLTEI